MMDKCSSALLTIRIIEILKDTDKSNPITQAELARRLGVDRKTIWRAFLNMEREMNFTPARLAGKGYYYKRSSDELEPYEVRLLVDGVASSISMGENEAEKLIAKLVRLASVRERQSLLRAIDGGEPVRSERDAILLNIDLISEAISKKRQIVFEYRDADRKTEKLKVSPGRTLFSSGHYLLIAKRSDCGIISAFKIDQMSNIGILNTVHTDISSSELSRFKQAP